MSVRDDFLDEAEYIRLQGGEIPEVSLYESLNVLAEKGLVPTETERRCLGEAVIRRYRDIIRRDLDPENRTETFFRGPERARTNWQRLFKFARENDFPLEPLRMEIGQWLHNYLAREVLEITRGKNYNTLGLEEAELGQWLKDLGIEDRRTTDLAKMVASVKTLEWRRAVAKSRRGDKPDHGPEGADRSND